MLFVLSFLIFVLIDLSPGDPAVTLAGNNPDPVLISQLRHDLHLDDSLPVRYGRWVGNAVQGDFGKSFISRQDVGPTIWSKLPITLSLAGLTLAFSAVVGVTLGVLGALRPRSVLDRGITTSQSLVLALPQFWIALMLVLFLSVYHRALPAIGYAKFSESPWQWFRHLILPAAALSTTTVSTIALQLKGSLVETLGRDYILTARAKGLGGTKIVFKHALRNAAIPVVTVFGLQAAYLVGGSVIIERVFAIAGLGTLLIDSAQNGDINPLLGIVVVFTVVAILMNAVVDIAYGYLNPKLRV
jgi:peptide/nickel transport system permease protein